MRLPFPETIPAQAPHAPRVGPFVGLALACVSVLAVTARVHAEDAQALARTLLLEGRHAEARAAYERLAAQEPVAAAIGIARCRRAVGQIDEAIRGLITAAERHPKVAMLRAELGSLEFERGHHAAARAHVDSALAVDPDLPAARFLMAELHRVAGRISEANDAYVWFIRLYNRDQDRIDEPEVLRWIGLAAAYYARWNRNSGQFHFLVNTLYPDIVKRDSLYWPARLEAALLFIEKYNRSDAADELDAAAAINPNAAELHAARALIALQQFDLDSARAAIDHALAINPRLLVAFQLRADVQMVASGPRAALPILQQARELNPADEETLGRLAAVYGALDGLSNASGAGRMQAVVAEAVGRNEHCGSFFTALAASLDLMQRYPHAASYYEEARRRMPQLVATPGQLGLVYMRLGEEARARETLKESFEIDPFNVRVKNTLRVLELLDEYAKIETAHFVIRFDGRDSLLAGYASRYLEGEVYPEIVKQLAGEPQGKSLIEIFSSAKGTSGHSWFSARMVGLPFIGTVGACAGKMVAIASPTDGRRRFNWARVLKHEFVHIVNLQQTDFNIPRWYTEALAVRHEGPGRPRMWDRVLARRVVVDSLFDLDTIHLGFVRPSSGEDWILAYYQAELYARYIAETYGDGALGKMIAAYAGNLDTRGALKRSFGITQEEFEKRYRAYLDRITGGTGPREDAEVADNLSEMQAEAERNPHDAHLLARLGRAFLRAGNAPRAQEYAARALEMDPRQQLAAFVVARVLVSRGEKPKAMDLLRAALNRKAPNADALALLTELTLEAKSFAEAESLASMGDERLPLAADWLRGLAMVYRETHDRERLAVVLARQAERDPDDFAIRLELAQLANDRNDFATAGRWALDALHVDVLNADAHAILARGLAEDRRHERSMEEYQTAIALKPDKHEWRLALAKLCTTAGKKDLARRVLAALLDRDPNYPGAAELRDSLK